MTVRTNQTPRDSWSTTTQNKHLISICPNFKSYLEFLILEIKCFLTTIQMNLYWDSDSTMSSNTTLQFNHHKGERKNYLNDTWNKMMNILKKNGCWNQWQSEPIERHVILYPRPHTQNKHLISICPNFKSYLEFHILEIKCFLTTIWMNLYWDIRCHPTSHYNSITINEKEKIT